MSEAYTAQAATQALTEGAIKDIPFEKNDNGQYTRGAAKQLLTRVTTILTEQFTTIESTQDGMAELLEDSINPFTLIKTNTRGDAKKIMEKYNTTLSLRQRSFVPHSSQTVVYNTDNSVCNPTDAPRSTSCHVQ